MKTWIRFIVFCSCLVAVASGTAAMLLAQPEPTQVIATEFAFDPAAMSVQAGSQVDLVLTNAGQAPHDITFELDGGRVVGSDVARGGQVVTMTFSAPALTGSFAYYCSIGDHKERGMGGVLTVTAPPEQFEVVADGLLSPRGLYADGDSLYVGEGGTGTDGMGFRPGNLDGQVTWLSMTDPTSRTVLVGGLANAVDPGGGVIGANHAVPVAGSEDIWVTLSGGPGHPDPKAQLLRVSDGQTSVQADLWAFEEANDPDQDGVDSNPWRVVEGPNGILYVSDPGANAVLRVDTSPTCAPDCVSLFALFEPVGMEPDGTPISAVPTGLAWDKGGNGMYVSLLASFAAGEAQVRQIVDMNGNGSALDDGENTLVTDGLTMAVDVAMDPAGRLWALQFGGFAAQGSLSEVGKNGIGRVIEGLAAPSALAFTAGGDALVAVGTEGSGFTTNRVVRIPAERLSGNAPTPTPTTEPPTPAFENWPLYLPWAHRPVTGEPRVAHVTDPVVTRARSGR